MLIARRLLKHHSVCMRDPTERENTMVSATEAAMAPEARHYSVWHIDPLHSLAEFSVRHMMVTNVRGRLVGISGTIVDAGEDPTYSSVNAAIDVTTLVTGDPQRDEHLRSADFFDVAKYPSILSRVGPYQDHARSS